MEGWIPGKRWDQFKDLIKEGSVYTVEKFDLAKPKKNYRSVDNPIRICFTWRTKVAEIVPAPQNFPMFAYTALPLNKLSDRVDNIITLSDVVGLVNKVTPLLPPYGKAKSHRRQLYITDGSTYATVTLWGEQADSLDIDELIAASAEGPVIVLFVGMTVGEYSGSLALQSTSVTRCYVNAPLPEIADVRESTKDLPYRIEWHTGKNKNDAEAIPSSITEISTFEPNDIMGMRYKLSAKITEIHEGDGWYYMSCTDCWKKLIQENGNYRCPDCTTTVPLPRYRFVARAIDANSTASDDTKFADLYFFGPKGEAAIGQKALSLMASVNKQPTRLPDDLLAIVGKEFNVVVSPRHESLDAYHMHFQVEIVDPIIQPTVRHEQGTPGPSTSQAPQDLLALQPTEQAQTAEEMSTPPPSTDTTPQHPPSGSSAKTKRKNNGGGKAPKSKKGLQFSEED